MRYHQLIIDLHFIFQLRDELKKIIKSVDYAIFTTSISLEPVILNLKKCKLRENFFYENLEIILPKFSYIVNPIECENKIPINSIPVEIKITCRTPEVLLLVEEALLSRLQDFCIEVQKDDSVDSVELVPGITNDHPGKFFVNSNLIHFLFKISNLHNDS